MSDNARSTALLPAFIALAMVLSACEEERPPRTVTEFVENPIMLEAAMVRCAQDRDRTRYDPECVNARQAVTIIEAREEEARKAELEARSEAKRQALRRAQEAAAEARRRAAEEQRLREEAEYLAQFGTVTEEGDGENVEGVTEGNVPEGEPLPPAAGDEPGSQPEPVTGDESLPPVGEPPPEQ